MSLVHCLGRTNGSVQPQGTRHRFERRSVF